MGFGNLAKCDLARRITGDRLDGKHLEIFDRAPLVEGHLDVDGVLEATLLKVGSQLATGAGADGVGDVTEADAEGGGFLAIDLPLKFGGRVLDREVNGF